MLHVKRLATILMCAGFFALVVGGAAYLVIAAGMWQTDIGFAMGAVRILAAMAALFGTVLGITLCVKEGKNL